MQFRSTLHAIVGVQLAFIELKGGNGDGVVHLVESAVHVRGEYARMLGRHVSNHFIGAASVCHLDRVRMCGFVGSLTRPSTVPAGTVRFGEK